MECHTKQLAINTNTVTPLTYILLTNSKEYDASVLSSIARSDDNSRYIHVTSEKRDIIKITRIQKKMLPKKIIITTIRKFVHTGIII